MNRIPKIIEIEEYQTIQLPEIEISTEQAMELHSSYSKYLSIEPPSFLNGQQWQLTSKGWVGHIPLSEKLHFTLYPKVPIVNIFRMLEYAYRLDLEFPEGLIDSDSIDGFI